MTFSQLLELEGSITLIHGDEGSFDIEGISHSDDPQSGTFVFLKNKRFFNSLGRKSKEQSFTETGVFVEQKFWSTLGEQEQVRLKSSFTWLAILGDVNRAMCTLSKPFYDKMYGDLNLQVDARQMGTALVDPTADISQGVFIGEDVTIEKNVKLMPGCVILPKVTIAQGTILFPNVTIYPYTKIGAHCRIHSGTVIGTDGFGYNFFDGKHQKIWHLAGVELGEHVEIGCNTMIDAGAFTPTYIGDGSKIDNDVQISHNVKIQKHVIICGKTGIAGSVEIDDYCAFGAMSAVAPAARIGRGAQVAAKAGVSENAVVPDGATMAGYPARPLKEWMRAQATLSKISKSGVKK